MEVAVLGSPSLTVRARVSVDIQQHLKKKSIPLRLRAGDYTSTKIFASDIRMCTGVCLGDVPFITVRL